MSYPIPIKQRTPIDALTGIKSSLYNIRQVIALTYLIYVASGRKAFVEYCHYENNKLSLKPELLATIKNYLNKNDIDTIINDNPLLNNQYEPLYVGMTLLFRLANLKMNGKSSTAERTGGLRFPKQIYFASNIVVLDLIISGFPDEFLKTSLFEWLKNQHSSNREFENKVCSFLSICTTFTQFKLRDENGNEIFFQTEGVYQAIKAGQNGVSIEDSKESVGPTRIYKNIIREELEPWIKQSNRGLCFSEQNTISPTDFSQIISTTLDICNVKDDTVSQQQLNFDVTLQDNSRKPLQQIYYGAPGTGKSHEIKRQTAEAEKEGRVFRTTFHPDSDYSTFVGCYKPIMKPTGVTLASGEKEEIIAYKFVPQAFTNAYVKAWQTTESVYLIIEEINRGNCAQIFGDLFQLLDRAGDGQSDYPIKADTDLAQYLKETLGNEHEGIAEGKLKLPSNLYIWATMNTSDQSLFPIDSAFKRRWDWQYVPIRKGVNDKGETINWKIEANGKPYDWWKFLQVINNKIEQATNSEDKKLGFFFCKAQNGIIDAKTFVSKVVFYLWNDVFKDFVDDSGDLFKDTDDSRLTFTQFYDVDDNGKPVMEAKVELFLKNLGVPANEYEDDSADEDIEDGSYFINGVECKKYRHIYKNSIEAYLKNFPDKTVEEVIKDWGTINTGLLCTQNEYEEIVRTRKITNPVIETRFTPIEYKGEKLFINFTKAKATKEKIEPDIELINSKDWGIHIEKK